MDDCYRATRFFLFLLLLLALWVLPAYCEQKVVIDFQGSDYKSSPDGGAKVENFTTPQGASALKVVCPDQKGYPGVSLKPAQGNWDLSGFAYISAFLSNPGDKAIRVMMRVDNPGDWRKNPWNTEAVTIPAGQSKELKVWFGYAWGRKGYPLNPAKISRVLIFTQKPKGDKAFVVEKLLADGKTGDIPGSVKSSIKVSPKADLLKMDTGAVSMKAKDKGAKATAAKTAAGKPAVKVSFPSDSNESWPATYITTKEGYAWNLNQYNQVNFKVYNSGKKKLRLFCRLDNSNANGRTHCLTGDATLAPGQSKTLVVDFVTEKFWTGKSGSGLVFDSSDVKGITIFSDKNAAGGEVLIEGIKGEAVKAPLPEWTGKRPPVGGDWSLTFEENFDGDTLNRKLWELPVNPGESPANCHQEPASIWGMSTINRPQNALINSGMLKLKAEKKPAGAKCDDAKLDKRKYYSTCVTSFNGFAQKYGYFEARMKLPRALGLWPAFWLMPDRGEEAGEWWKRIDTDKGGMEFDIMEHLTRFGPYCYHMALHWDGYGKKHKSIGATNVYFRTDEEGYFTSGLLWEPGKATFFCNGKKVGVWENERVSNVPAFVLFTMPFGGWGKITVEENKLPDTFDIDYVRVWQRADLKNK